MAPVIYRIPTQLSLRLFSGDPRRVAVVGGVVLWEALLWIVLAMMIAKIPGAYAETPSAWAILGLVGVGFAVSYRLSQMEMSAPWRWLLGAVATVVVVQVTARLDLVESLRVWDVGWVSELFDLDGAAWHRRGHIDHLVSSVVMVMVWFRGVRLGGMELDQRPMLPTALIALPIFGLSFAVGDNAGLIDTVRIVGLLFLAVGLGVVAFRTTLRVHAGHEGGFAAAGLSFLSTLGVMAVAVTIFVLLITVLLAAIAGAGIADPVTEGLGTLLRAILTPISYVLSGVIWLVREILGINSVTVSSTSHLPPEFLDQPLEVRDGEGSSFMRMLIRVLGGIAVVVVVAALVMLLFRRFVRRREEEDEVRESIWTEASFRKDLMDGLRALRDRLRIRPHSGPSVAPIAALYYEVLKHAAAQGATRPPAATPLQFAATLRRTYRSDLPLEISRRFSDLCYGGRDSAGPEVERLQGAWQALKRTD